MTDDTARAWTDAELDEALAELNSDYDPSPVEIAHLRRRIFRDSIAVAKPRRSGRRRRAIVTGATVLALGVGGAAAAANGVFDQQSADAFDSGNTYPFHIDSGTAVLRASTPTPDGGDAQFWTAKKGKVKCGAVLLDDAGRRPPGKPYLPQSQCSDDGGQPGGGEYWQSNKTGAQFFIFANRVESAAVSLTFINPVSGVRITAAVNDGYYILFVPHLDNGDYGITLAHADGSNTVFQQPWVSPTKQPG